MLQPQHPHVHIVQEPRHNTAYSQQQRVKPVWQLPRTPETHEVQYTHSMLPAAFDSIE